MRWILAHYGVEVCRIQGTIFWVIVRVARPIGVSAIPNLVGSHVSGRAEEVTGAWQQSGGTGVSAGHGDINGNLHTAIIYAVVHSAIWLAVVKEFHGNAQAIGWKLRHDCRLRGRRAVSACAQAIFRA